MSSCNTAIKITPYEIIDVTKHTDLEWSFRVRSDMAIQYGQYIDLVLPMYGEVPIAISDFGNGYLEIMGSKHGCTMEALFEKKIGDQVWLRKLRDRVTRYRSSTTSTWLSSHRGLALAR